MKPLDWFTLGVFALLLGLVIYLVRRDEGHSLLHYRHSADLREWLFSNPYNFVTSTVHQHSLNEISDFEALYRLKFAKDEVLSIVTSLSNAANDILDKIEEGEIAVKYGVEKALVDLAFEFGKSTKPIRRRRDEQDDLV